MNELCLALSFAFYRETRAEFWLALTSLFATRRLIRSLARPMLREAP